jgi:hypothetical protein
VVIGELAAHTTTTTTTTTTTATADWSWWQKSPGAIIRLYQRATE